MLIDGVTLSRIVAGEVTLQFRRWKRPTVKTGGTLLTASGLLAIDEVRRVEQAAVSDADARAAGFESAELLMEAVDGRGRSGDLFRVALRYAGPDPRVALRESVPDAEEVARIRERLDGWDRRSPVGPWTLRALEAIDACPETRAGDLADAMDMEKARFKTNVRKLKGLGLTESLEVGYRLSPRGRAILDSLIEEGSGGV